MDKFKFTSGTIDAINAASVETMLCGEDVLSPMFLLLGLASNEAGYSKAVIINAGIDPSFLKKTISKYFKVCFESPCGETSISQEVHSIMLLAQKIALESRRSSISPMDLLYALFQRDCKEVQTVLTDMDVCYEKTKKLVEKSYVLATQREDSEPKINKQEKTVQVASKNQMSTTFTMPPMLSKCGRDLTALAEAGKLDPVIGRNNEIEKTVRTLLRRSKSNPCLVGKAGVGKTAIVEGLAQMIAEQQAPSTMRDKRIVELNMAELFSGTKYRGDLEERLTKVLEEVAREPRIILFIDELHTVFDNSASEGAVSAANILKPALARGNISLIGATTNEEYRKYIEKDAAFERRFQCISIDEPSKKETIEILHNIKDKYEQHHNLKIGDAALSAAVEFSVQYIANRQLPDKAIDVLDETASYCKERGIRLSGPALGRPPKDVPPDKKQNYIDECERVEVERRFSLAKRVCGLGLITARLKETACHCIAMSVLVLNLRKVQRAILTFWRSSLALMISMRKSVFVQWPLLILVRIH